MDDKYQKQIQGITTETLKVISENREKALEYAKRGIEQNEPEKLTDEYIELVADGMQTLAKNILEQRTRIAS